MIADIAILTACALSALAGYATGVHTRRLTQPDPRGVEGG